MYRNMIPLATALPLLAALGGAAQAQTAAYPQVLVNQQPVQFSGQPPVEQNGRLLIPLRGVLEKMGAFVSYDSQSKTITAYRGATRITLPVGSRQALVNDRAVSLDVPAQVTNGSTLVPLRFVAESLGAQVRYDYANRTVAIETTAAGGAAGTVANGATSATGTIGATGGTGNASSAINPPVVTNETTVTGEVVGVFADVAPRRIVVRVPGTNGGAAQERTFPLRDNATVTVRRPNGNAVDVTLNRVWAGDTVEVRQSAAGVASSVQVVRRAVNPNGRYGGANGNGNAADGRPAPAAGGSTAAAPATQSTFKGEFLDFTKNGSRYLLKMTDGRQIEVEDDVPVFYESHRVGAGDLRSGDQLTISVDPKTKRGTRILIAPEQ